MNEWNVSRVPLDGVWQMAFCPIGEGSPEGVAARAKIPYSVPGDVHTPLITQGLIAEPLYGMNDLDCRWVEKQEFWCERSFTVEADALRRRMALTFEGLDCTADIWLNGCFLGRTENAFVEMHFDVSAVVKAGENVLLVRIDEGLETAKRKDLGMMAMCWNNDQPYRTLMRKPQFVYGWDWTIWLPSCGIWRSVYLTGYDTARLTHVYAVPGGSLQEGMPCEVKVDAAAEVCADAALQVECTLLDREGQEVDRLCQPLSAEKLVLRVADAHLWWVNGMGEAYLYTLKTVLKTADGAVLDHRSQQVGLRTIAIEEKPLPGDERTFTFVLNGQPVFCKGANHVPCDCLPGRITPEKERTLIAQARDAHINLLRIWGGGVYSSEAFMAACDEAGIMVWHDFMYACGYYPDHDPEFVASITDEARKAILRLREHASLIGWAGNNEIQDMYRSQKQWHPELPWYGGTIYEQLLPALMQELCPTLIYRESSPMGEGRTADTQCGDQHIWEMTHQPGTAHYMDLWHFTDIPVKFMSEFGILGAMTLETARTCIPAEDMRPDAPMWLHHTNSHADHMLMEMMEERYFGMQQDRDITQYTLRSQVLQADITRHIYDEFRCRKFVCSGLLFWTLSDSMGLHTWSLIDYGLHCKPVYHALKRSMAPVSVGIRGYDVQNRAGEAEYLRHWKEAPGLLEVWGMNDTLDAHPVTVRYQLMTMQGEVLAADEAEAVLSPNACQCVLKVPVGDVQFDPHETLLHATLLEDGRVVAENRYFFAPFGQLHLPKTQVSCQAETLADGTYRVSLRAEGFVWLVHLEEEGVCYSDNDFELWPGEMRTVIASTEKEKFTPVLHWIGEKEKNV